MTVPALDQATLLRVAADLVVVVHATFVVFVVLGALLVLRWPRLVWMHLPAAAWGVFIEFRGWICPLTPFENYLRQRSGASTYQGEFIDHYVLPLLYPAHLTRHRQIWLGTVAALINVLLYWRVVRRAAPRRGSRSEPAATRASARPCGADASRSPNAAGERDGAGPD